MHSAEHVRLYPHYEMHEIADIQEGLVSQLLNSLSQLCPFYIPHSYTFSPSSKAIRAIQAKSPKVNAQ